MAVKARDDVTLASVADVANVRRYYLLQSSTLAAPSAPTANPAPSPWVTSEPTYSEGSTNTLYTVDLTVFSDGTFDYSIVSKSSSYEAAKSAFNKAVAAGTLADSKAKTFTSTPTVPYSVGDLWRNGNKVYICTTARATGSYTASDWTLTADKTSENTAADTSKVGGTASATVIQNIATALANGKPFIQQATPSATAVGQLWFPTDSSGRVIGMKVSTATGTGSWQDYLMMAGQILVPGSVGTTEIGPEGVTAANIKASNELWAKLASFAKVTTDMLIAGGAVITGDMIVQNINGKTFTGCDFVIPYNNATGDFGLHLSTVDGSIRNIDVTGGETPIITTGEWAGTRGDQEVTVKVGFETYSGMSIILTPEKTTSTDYRWRMWRPVVTGYTTIGFKVRWLTNDTNIFVTDSTAGAVGFQWAVLNRPTRANIG